MAKPFSLALQEGFAKPSRGDRLNVWGEELVSLAYRLDAVADELPEPAKGLLVEVFEEIGRLVREASHG